MAQLAILGHTTRGREVIELLEMLGGRNKHNYSANCDSLCFFIGKNNTIHYDWVNNCYDDEDIFVFTLEEFLEKFPYKAGDKVSSKYLKNYKIEKMEWGDINNRVIYKLQGMGWYNVDELQPYKEETKEDLCVYDKLDFEQEPCADKIELVLGDNYEIKVENGKTYVVRKKPQYPKTLSECCDILGVDLSNCVITGYEAFKLEFLQGLLICRDAYWKLYGEEKGLGKPWRPELNSKKRKFALSNVGGNISFEIYGEYNSILCFPTEEMRDTFCKNFREDIEQCKELL